MGGLAGAGAESESDEAEGEGFDEFHRYLFVGMFWLMMVQAALAARTGSRGRFRATPIPLCNWKLVQNAGFLAFA